MLHLTQLGFRTFNLVEVLNQLVVVLIEIQSAMLKSNGLVGRILGKQSAARYLNFIQFVSQLRRMNGGVTRTV